MSNQEIRNPRPENNEMDTGVLIHLMISGFRKLGRFIDRLIESIQELLLLLFLFLKKWAIWIVIVTAIGYGVGMFRTYTNAGGARYYSEMTARFNQGSGLTLYSTIDYLNGLAATGDRNALAQIFSISEQEAGNILSFAADSVGDELITSEMYYQQYLRFDRSSILRMDTFWTRTMPYAEFKKSLTRYNMPLQKVTITLSNATGFEKLQKGFVDLINSNPVLAKNKSIRDSLRKKEEQLVLSSLSSVDTLREVYNDRLRSRGDERGVSGNNIILDKMLKIPNPELDLYSTQLILKDEFKRIEFDAINNQDIVQVYAPFYKNGKKSDSSAQYAIPYAIKAFVAVFVLLLIVELYKALAQYEKRKKNDAI